MKLPRPSVCHKVWNRLGSVLLRGLASLYLSCFVVWACCGAQQDKNQRLNCRPSILSSERNGRFDASTRSRGSLLPYACFRESIQPLQKKFKFLIALSVRTRGRSSVSQQCDAKATLGCRCPNRLLTPLLLRLCETTRGTHSTPAHRSDPQSSQR
jgi:hypothetical protein